MIGMVRVHAPAASNSPVIARLDRAIQHAAADVVRANSSTLASGILDRPVEPGDDSRICGRQLALHPIMLPPRSIG